MKQSIIFLLFLLTTGFSFCKPLHSIRSQSRLNDSSRSIISKPPTNYQKAEFYLAKLRAAKAKNPMQLAKQMADEDAFFKAIAKIRDFGKESSLLSEFTDPFYDDHITLSRYLGRMVRMYKDMNYKYGELWVRKEMADLHLREGKIQLAKNEMVQLIKEYEKTSYPDLPNYYDLLSGIYLNDNQYKNALATAFQTIKHIRCAGDSLFLDNFYQRIASIYNMLDNPKTLDWFYKIVNNYISGKRPKAFYLNMEDYARIAAKYHKGDEGRKFLFDFNKKYPSKNNSDLNEFYLALMTLYNATGQSKETEVFFQKHIKLINQMIRSGEIKLANANNLNVGMYFYSKKQYQTARKYFLAYLKKPSKEYPYLKFPNVYLLLYRIDSLQGNYSSAMRNLRRYDAIKDSIFNIAKIRQIEELQIIYETTEKQKDIQLLKSTQATQQIKLAQTENNRNWILAGSAMLLALLAVSYRGYRLKRKTSSVLLEKNKMLQHFISEKEWLLKEVHHRVKNNLHTVICLLESQAAYLENDALKAIETSQHRIYAMSLIHQKLYQSEDIKTINMATYIPEFMGYLNNSFDTEKAVRFHLDIESLQLGISLAIPLALIINEAVTNSFKYAFIQSRRGVITINLHQHKDIIILEIADNGIGIDPDFATKHPESLGMKLMNGLSEDINASIQVENCNGTKITLIFNKDPFDEKRNVAEHSLIKQFQL